ncbi:MAG: glycosyltransferase family 4 protein [Cyclobacteriaceae bacterium]|nr:glycosyltransferase family 4 protein [Cyclobacteriaceae bacterium]
MNQGRAQILIESSSLRYINTGIGQYCFHLLRALSKLQHDNFELSAFATPSALTNISRLNVTQQNATWIRRHSPQFLMPYLFKKFDLWHITSESTKFTRIRNSTKVLLTIHGLHFVDELPWNEAKALLKYVQRLIDRADQITVVSDYTGNLVRQYLSVENVPIDRIYHGVDFSFSSITTPVDAPPGKFLFSIGTFFERKNFHSLLPFIKLLDDYSLIIAGNTSKHYGYFIQERINDLGLGNKVFLPGEINDSEKRWYYQNCKAFVFPSLSEGFGIPIIEAFYFGKPVFTTRNGSIPEIGKSIAHYWEGFDPLYMKKVFLEAMETTAQDPEFISQRINYAKSFTWEEAAANYCSLYNRLLH